MIKAKEMLLSDAINAAIDSELKIIKLKRIIGSLICALAVAGVMIFRRRNG